MLFWTLAGALAALAFLPLLGALFRGGRDEGGSDLAIYRDQLQEIDRDEARGLLSQAEAERVRLEVQRRLLDADRRRQGPAGAAPRWASLGAAVLAFLAVVGGGLALYATMGAPGYGDQPVAQRLAAADQRRAERPSQDEAEAGAASLLSAAPEPDQEVAELMTRLRETVAERPDDPRGLELLARNEARMGNYQAAREAQSRLLELKGDAADAEERAFLGEMMVMSAGGLVTGAAEDAFRAALSDDPENGRAAYYLGLGEAQIGRPDRAYRIWRPLLDRSPPDAPWVGPIQSHIEQVAAQAGIRYSPSGLPGPDADQRAAAEEMDPEARQQMIEGMVASLSERLATEGGSAAEWARLIRAYGVLGRDDRARAIWTEAQQVFGDHPDALSTLRSAAQEAGVAG